MCAQSLRCLKLKYLSFFSARRISRHLGRDVSEKLRPLHVLRRSPSSLKFRSWNQFCCTIRGPHNGLVLRQTSSPRNNVNIIDLNWALIHMITTLLKLAYIVGNLVGILGVTVAHICFNQDMYWWEWSHSQAQFTRKVTVAQFRMFLHLSLVQERIHGGKSLLSSRSDFRGELKLRRRLENQSIWIWTTAETSLQHDLQNMKRRIVRFREGQHSSEKEEGNSTFASRFSNFNKAYMGQAEVGCILTGR